MVVVALDLLVLDFMKFRDLMVEMVLLFRVVMAEPVLNLLVNRQLVVPLPFLMV